MEKNVVRIPISNKQRQINKHGEGYVPCEVSSRWLQFDSYGTENGLVMVNVMTENEEGIEKKICELVLTKDDILRAVNNINFDL